jgi:hypothetical protein
MSASNQGGGATGTGMQGGIGPNGIQGSGGGLSGSTSPTGIQGGGQRPQGSPQQASNAPLATGSQQNQMQNQLQNQTGLVDVNLNNVRLDIAKNLNIDASKVPVTVQLPVTAAANVCGVDVNALTAQKQQGGGTPNCTANNANQATQAVQTSIR